jgi:hypothetical protein
VPDGWFASFTWQPSPEPVLGYVIQRIDSVEGGFIRLHGGLIQGTAFTSGYPFMPGDRFLVRAVKLVTGATGSFHALSLGAIARAAGNAVVDCNGVAGGTALPGLPCDDGDAATVNDLYTAECTCAGELTTGMGATSDAGVTIAHRGDALVLRSEEGLPACFEVRDTAGRLIQSGSLSSNEALLSLDGISPGLHLLQLRAINGVVVATHRFVVDR